MKKNSQAKKKVELKSVGRANAFSIRLFAFNGNTAWIANQLQCSRKISLKCAFHKRQVFTQEYDCDVCLVGFFLSKRCIHWYTVRLRNCEFRNQRMKFLFPKIDDIHPSGMKLWLSKDIRHLNKWISLKINTFWSELCDKICWLRLEYYVLITIILFLVGSSKCAEITRMNRFRLT